MGALLGVETALASLFALLFTPFGIPFMILSLWLWFHLFAWFVIMFMCDIYTLFDTDYRGAFEQIRSMFYLTLRQNNFLTANFLPINFLLGCILVHEEQLKELPHYEGTTTDAVHIFEGKEDWMSFAKVKKFMRFAMSMYGWKFVIYRHIKMIYPFGLLRLVLNNIYCFFYRPKSIVVKGDILRRNLAAFLSQSQTLLDDVYYASFINDIYKVPFVVSVDKESRTILISIRGSLSFNDWVVDFTADPKPIFIEGSSFDSRTHKGMWKCARYVCDELEENGIIDVMRNKYQNYDLVVTGHSLGAGTSVLLGLQLKRNYPSVKVYAFSCPGWLVDEALAQKCKDFVFVIGLGDDTVLRAGINSAINLIENGARELKKTTCSLIKILFKGVKFVTVCTFGMDIQVSPVGPPNRKNTTEDDKDNGRTSPLYLPGHILHMVRMTENTADGGKKRYLAMRWGLREEFTEILVMPRMFKDHEPQNVMQAIDTIDRYQQSKPIDVE